MLKNLTELTLNLSYGQLRNLDALPKLSKRVQLILNLSGDQVSNLDMLSDLSSLKQLDIEIGTGNNVFDRMKPQVPNLEVLSTLPHLQSLSIENATRAQRVSLRKIPAGLVELKF